MLDIQPLRAGCCSFGSIRLLELLSIHLNHKIYDDDPVKSYCMSAIQTRVPVECRQSLAAADFEGTVAGQLLAECNWLPAKLHPKLLLALLWASLANSVPASIWAVAHVLQPQHAQHLQSIRAQCCELAERSQDDGSKGDVHSEKQSPAAADASAWESSILQVRANTVQQHVACLSASHLHSC